MKEILLTKGRIAIVDDCDFDLLNKWKWQALKHRYTFYARRTSEANGKKVTIQMHRYILGLVPGDGKIVDHKDRNGLNNQRSNLRIVTLSLNSYHCKMQKHNTSGFRGVNLYKKSHQYWRVRIGVNNKRIDCGVFRNVIEAALAYDRAAIKYFGDNAVLNFPDRRSL